MATIALQDGKVVTNTINNITKASCSCCGCGIYAPTTERPGAVVIISGVASCSFPTGDEGVTEPAPDINGSYTLAYGSYDVPYPGFGWFYLGSVGIAENFVIRMICFDATDTEPAYLELQITADINTAGVTLNPAIYFIANSDLTVSPTFYNTISCGPDVPNAGEGGSATITFQ